MGGGGWVQARAIQCFITLQNSNLVPGLVSSYHQTLLDTNTPILTKAPAPAILAQTGKCEQCVTWWRKGFESFIFHSKVSMFYWKRKQKYLSSYISLAEILKLSDERYDNIHFETIPGSKKQIEWFENLTRFLFYFYRMKNPTCWESWQSVWRNPVSRVNFLPKSLNDYDEDLSTTNEEVFDSVTMCVCLSVRLAKVRLKHWIFIFHLSVLS